MVCYQPNVPLIKCCCHIQSRLTGSPLYDVHVIRKKWITLMFLFPNLYVKWSPNMILDGSMQTSTCSQAVHSSPIPSQGLSHVMLQSAILHRNQSTLWWLRLTEFFMFLYWTVHLSKSKLLSLQKEGQSSDNPKPISESTVLLMLHEHAVSY